MPELCRRRDDCRLCCMRDLELVLALTPTPPANAFVTAERLHERQPVFPLELFLCRACGHVQLRDVVDPHLLFEEYVYVSGTSPVFVDHFRRYAERLINHYGIRPGLAVDVGSNDGTLLRFLHERGFAVLGIDPAREIARQASEAGIETLPAFFTPELAHRIRRERGPAAVVTANNVFAHADDLVGIIRGVRELLAPDGLFTFEVSYLVDVYEKALFDTIYHEHVAYHAVTPLVRFFGRHGMELIAAERVPSHGGSLRGIVQIAGGPRTSDGSVEALVALERRLALQEPSTFREFAERIAARGDELGKLLRGLRADGKRIAGFGAPAKATTLMYHFGLDRETIEFIVDDSPLKQGLYSPGLHVPVLPSAAIAERAPDFLVILAWNFADAIIAKNESYRAAGGKFITPLPDVVVY